MTVAELRTALLDCPDDADVKLANRGADSDIDVVLHHLEHWTWEYNGKTVNDISLHAPEVDHYR